MVNERLPEIMKELAGLCNKMRDQRLVILKDNEEAIAEDLKNADKEDSDDNDAVADDGDEDFKDDGEDENVFAKAKKAHKKGEEGDEDDYDEEDDSDYEFTGGDLAIYDSALDPIDELLFVKENLERINAVDAAYMSRLLSALNPDEVAKFNENMQTAQALKDREEVVRKQADEMVDKKKFSY